MEPEDKEEKAVVALRVLDAKGEVPSRLVKGEDYRLELHAGLERPIVFSVQLM